MEVIKLKGVIKFYNTAKGFGFIKMKDSDIEYFFHYTNLKSLSILKDDNVTFDVIPSKHKAGEFQATHIEKV